MLKQQTSGHAFACWYPVGTPENKAAWEKNLSEGRLSTLAVAKGQIVDEVPVDLTSGSA